MVLVLGILACLGLWWLSTKGRRLDPRLTPGLVRRAGSWGALALAALFLLRGQLGLALVLGLGGVWLMEGAEGLGRRARDLVKGFAAKGSPGGGFPGKRPRRLFRSGLIELEVGPGDEPLGGRVLGGPRAGVSLDALGPEEIRALARLCRAGDPDGSRLLQAYLDRRRPGWRVDAEADRDPGAFRPAKPGAMTEEEAHQILGLQRGATAEEIRAAHRRLMKSAHPDQGGSAERAARLNAARDRLTNRHR